jgi:peptidoglycan/LPS O-acetylase OafA/YrhL
MREPRIDAMRGAAALAVLLLHSHHAWYLAVGAGAPPEGRLRLLDHWLGIVTIPITFGNLGVNLFFILSGLCIHAWYLGDRHRGRGFSYLHYLRRRFWRLYPAYFAAVAFSLLCLAAAEFIRLHHLGAAHVSSHASNIVEQTLRYLTFTHTLSPSTFGGYNPPLYTMAIEAHFYLMYPAVIWGFRRYGAWPTLGTSVAISVALTAIVYALDQPGLTRVVMDSALVRWPEWIVGCLIAERWFRHRKADAFGWPVWRAAACSLLILVVALWLQVRAGLVLNLLWTAGIAVLVLPYLCREPGELVVERWLAALGIFSYSVYLVHWPVLRIAALTITPTAERLAMNLLYYVPIVLGIVLLAWLFFTAFEKPFLRRHAYSLRHATN